MERLIKRFKDRTATVGIIGLGYVGLPLAIEFGKAGFNVIGIDTVEKKVKNIHDGNSYIPDVDPEDINKLVSSGKLNASVDYSPLKNADSVSICVPTPLGKTKDPDISYIISAARKIADYLHKGELIVLESTTYPGTTEEIILPELEAKGFKVGEDFFLAFSPERVDPGNKIYKTKNTPKIIGGITERCTEVAKVLYSQAIDTVIPVSTTKSAEMVKLLENTFRAVNIALVNEVALMCDRLGIDVWEVIEAASTKPFGFMPFLPGPGLGGHCIPVDPYYLAWKLKTLDYKARFIELAGEINTGMPLHIVSIISDALNERQKSVKGSKILVLGVSYKKDIGDIRESPALDIIRLLIKKGAVISYNDPFVPVLSDYNDIKNVRIEEKVVRAADCILITTDHTIYDYEWIVEKARLVIDTRNATKGVKDGAGKVIKL
ncbi:MAG: nucleotide sugar dehydrogenase [Nitrospinota bacterium]